ncbi:MAG: tRNA lysidine(34) synthetase TilS [Pikeienuella sp.]|uniref:tRNA lysidine(34) synthetase TilS n=1 Tax=Pikeienuella sp. TaxID=2831957 RepID=UPI003918BD9C
MAEAAPVLSEVAEALDALLAGAAPRLGLAVSGGGDSMALMHAAADWAKARGAALSVATVDHGLRPDSAEEAAFVARDAAALSLPHETILWEGRGAAGNLQAAARAARRRLLSAWAAREGLDAVALGHTMDDQAETVLMRLARGSGVDGLSAMAARTEAEGAIWLRPLLGLRRADLRAFLEARGAGWVEDPSNEDLRFDRVRARRSLEALDPLGLTAEGLSSTAARMRSAREALDHAAAALAEEAAREGACGEMRLAVAPLRAAPTELSRRLLRAALARVSGAEYGARAEAEAALMSAILSWRLGGGRSLHGCLIRPDGPSHVMLAREAAAVDPAPASLPEGGAIWDGRFFLAARAGENGLVAPLGEAGARRLTEMAATGEWRAPAHWRAAPQAARITTPALWRGEALAAAPLAGWGEGLTARRAGAGWPGG